VTDLFVQILTGLVTMAVLAALGALLSILVQRGRYPRLPAPDPDLADTRADRRRYHLANGLACGVGAVAGAALWATPPLAGEGVLWRQSLYDHPAGRLLGPFFLLLAVGGLTVVPLVERLVAPGPLLHILTRSSARQFAAGIDLRPALRWLSVFIGSLAILLHLGMRNEHTTFVAEGVQWRDWPWQGDSTQPWADVADIRLVATFTAMTGRIVERPHLCLEFRDGSVLRLGKSATRSEPFWAEVAALASVRSGVAVRRLEHE
jgi:hypothetical protein